MKLAPVAVLETSAKRGDACSDEAGNGEPSPLKQLITQHIPWDSLPWTSTPRLLAELSAGAPSADWSAIAFDLLAIKLQQAPAQTPKGSHSKAQGKRSAALGIDGHHFPGPEGAEHLPS